MSLKQKKLGRLKSLTYVFYAAKIKRILAAAPTLSIVQIAGSNSWITPFRNG